MSTTRPETEMDDTPQETFVETALKLGGKSEEEARTTGAMDRADERVEELFEKAYQTTGSPVHLAVWDKELPLELFVAPETELAADTAEVMQKSLDVVRRHRDSGTLLDDKNKISVTVLNELAEAGYWGLLVDRKYGGQETPFVRFAQFLTAMATIDPTIAGLASVHGCIGAVDPVRSFGNEQQKQKYLPLLASGKRLSGFALTEPGAGSDLTALKTTAVLEGDHYVVNGEKLFITNAVPGRTVGLVCLIDGKPAVLVADLPDTENENFQLVTYGLWALKHTHNNGLKFKNFKVPKENLLDSGRGDGLTIAYHGLNRGRVSLCANAAGTMRLMLKSMLPWASYRRTYGQPIDQRELVQRRIGKMAGMIIACDALTEWGGWLLDQGFRGEMECIIAKIFGSECQKEAAIELYMKTHGGRSFLRGHLFGDNVHEFLAPCIYEGEGEMLGMAFFKSLVKEHGRKYFEPIGKALVAAGIKSPNPMNPAHAWALRSAALPYAKWRVGQSFGGWKAPTIPDVPEVLKKHLRYGTEALQKSRLQVDTLMRKFQLKLADRQCAMSDLSQEIQYLVVIITTCLYAAKTTDPLIHQAADVMCRELRQRISGSRPDLTYFRAVTRLGAAIADQGFGPLKGIEVPEIMMRYDS